MNSIELYLGRVIVGHTLMVLMVLMIVLGFSEFMTEIDDITADYTLLKGASYTLLKIPSYAYESFPMALLIGTLMGLGGLANNAELTILRVTGWSIGRIFLGVMKSVVILWILVAVMGEWIAPKTESLAKEIKGEALQKNFSIGDTADFWLKEGNRYIHVGRIISERMFYNVTIYTLKNNELSYHLFAQKAVFKEGSWYLENATQQALNWQTSYLQNESKTAYPRLDYNKKHLPSLTVALPISPELIQTLQIDARHMGIWDLYKYIGFLEDNQLDAEPYKLEFWRKISAPLVIFGMIAVVFPLIFGSQRQVSMGQRIFVGIMIGMSFHLINNIVGNLTVVYQLPTLVGAMFPPIILIIFATIFLRNLR